MAVIEPYFYDGQTKILEETLDIMAEYQLGRKIPKLDKANIITFLKTLTGEYQGVPLKVQEQ